MRGAARRGRSVWVSVGLVMGLLTGLGPAGCGGGAERGDGPRRAISTAGSSSGALTAGPLEAAPPATLDGAGLDAIDLRGGLSDARIAAVLAAFDTPPPRGDAVAWTSWRRSGLRALVVPRAAARALVAAAGGAAVRQETRLGSPEVWSVLVEGAELSRAAPEGLVTVHAGPIALARGRARLVARGWPVPGRGTAFGAASGSGPWGAGGAPSARARVELWAQVAGRGGGLAGSPLELWAPESLRLGLELEAGEVVVIVGAAPATDWGAEEPAGTAAAGQAGAGSASALALASVVDEPQGPSPEPGAAAGPEPAPELGAQPEPETEPGPPPEFVPGAVPLEIERAGPVGPTAPYFGAVLLGGLDERDGGAGGAAGDRAGARAGDRGGAGLRRVVILVPRVPERYTLRPAAASASRAGRGSGGNGPRDGGLAAR